MRFSLLCNGNGCYVMEQQILEPVEDFPRKNAVEAEYALFLCTPLECVGDFLYPTTELSYSESTFCPLSVSSSSRRTCMENWISTKIACAPSGLLGGIRQEALRQEEIAFLGKLPKKCPVWRILRRNSPVFFLFPGALLCWWDGASDFDSVFWFCT